LVGCHWQKGIFDPIKLAEKAWLAAAVAVAVAATVHVAVAF